MMSFESKVTITVTALFLLSLLVEAYLKAPWYCYIISMAIFVTYWCLSDRSMNKYIDETLEAERARDWMHQADALREESDRS